MKSVLITTLSLLTAPALLLTGCSTQSSQLSSSVRGSAIAGVIHGGQQPVANSRVYLMSVSSAGYGNASTSLLTAGTGSDANGFYVLSGSNGSFSVTGDYVCTTGSDVYLLALGGKSSPNSANNAGIALMAALGTCPASGTLAATAPDVSINEVTTVAAAYALSGFMSGPTTASMSGTSLAQTGLNNAFGIAASLANIASGTANPTVGSNGTMSVAKLNTMADIISTCINTDGTGSGCSTLFNNAPSGTTVPSDTITALLNIVHHPGTNVSALFDTINAQAPFQPVLATAPNDFSLTIQYTTPNMNGPLNLRADATGNVWFRDGGSNSNLVEKLSPTGSVLSGAGYAVGGIGGGDSIVLDAQGDAFLGNRSGFSILKLDPNGNLLSPANGYAGSCSNPNATLAAVTLDASGNVWGSGSGGCALKISNLGTVLSGSGYPSTPDNSVSLAMDSKNGAWIPGIADDDVRRVSSSGSIIADYGSDVFTPYAIAIDSSDSAWIANHANGSITHLLSSGSSTQISGGGLYNPNDLSIDGSNNIWVANNSFQLSAFSNNGTAITSTNGYVGATSGTISSLAVDGSGNIWTAMNGPDVIVEFVGLATPAAMPIMPGQLGARP